MARMSRRTRRTVIAALALLAGVLAAGVAAAQGASSDPLRDLLARGYYNAAAQLEGPNLVLRQPENPEAHYLYARALWLTGDADAARAQLDEALALVTEPPAAYLHLDGLLLADAGDTEAALTRLEAAFARSGDYQHAMDWGMVAWRAGATQAALAAYEAAAGTERGAREPWPALNRGRILALADRFEAAIEAFETAIVVFERSDSGDLGPPPIAYVEAFYRLGSLREALGDLDGAEQDYMAARSVDPNYTPAIEALDALARRAE